MTDPARPSTTRRGLAYAVASLFCASGVFFLGREAILRVSLADFLFFWYLFAQIGFIPLVLKDPRAAAWRFSRSKTPWIALYVCVDVLTAALFFLGLRYVSASVASFASQCHVLFVLIFGIALLKERFLRSEALGAGLIILGLCVITFTSQRAGILGLSLIIVANAMWGMNQVLVKKLVASEDPRVLAHLRTIAMMAAGLVMFALKGQGPVWPSATALAILVAGGLVGPFCNMLFRFMAIRDYDVTKVSLIAAQHPVLVVAFSFVLGMGAPDALKLGGGAMAFAGSCLLVGGRLRAERCRPS